MRTEEVINHCKECVDNINLFEKDNPSEILQNHINNEIDGYNVSVGETKVSNCESILDVNFKNEEGEDMKIDVIIGFEFEF